LGRKATTKDRKQDAQQYKVQQEALEGLITIGSDIEPFDAELSDIRRRISLIELASSNFRSEMQNLSTDTQGPTFVAGLDKAIDEAEERVAVILSTMDSGKPTEEISDKDKASELQENKKFNVTGMNLFVWSSDILLALSIMACGVVGATVGSIREEGRLGVRSILFGLAAGFIVFLAIKGGKQLFLIQASGQIAQFNPYSCALFGLIAGMFTERTFEILKIVTDAFYEKLEKVVKE